MNRDNVLEFLCHRIHVLHNLIVVPEIGHINVAHRCSGTHFMQSPLLCISFALRFDDTESDIYVI